MGKKLTAAETVVADVLSIEGFKTRVQYIDKVLGFAQTARRRRIDEFAIAAIPALIAGSPLSKEVATAAYRVALAVEAEREAVNGV